MSRSSEQADVVKRFLNAMSQLDVAAMFHELAADAVCEFPACPAGAPRMITGRQACQDFFSGMIRPMWSAYALIELEIHALADDPEQVVANYTSQGLLLDGSPYHNTYMSKFTVRDGSIDRWCEYFDPAPLARGVAILMGMESTETAEVLESPR